MSSFCAIGLIQSFLVGSSGSRICQVTCIRGAFCWESLGCMLSVLDCTMILSFNPLKVVPGEILSFLTEIFKTWQGIVVLKIAEYQFIVLDKKYTHWLVKSALVATSMTKLIVSSSARPVSESSIILLNEVAGGGCLFVFFFFFWPSLLSPWDPCTEFV